MSAPGEPTAGAVAGVLAAAAVIGGVGIVVLVNSVNKQEREPGAVYQQVREGYQVLLREEDGGEVEVARFPCVTPAGGHNEACPDTEGAPDE